MDTISVVGPEVRTLAASVRAKAGSRFLEGRAVPYGVWEDVGWFMEEFRHGSLTRTIRDNPNLPLLLFHDARKFPVGKVEKWTDTEDGLDAVWRMDTADDAQEAARLASEGMLTGLSVGFVPIARELAERDGRDWWTVTEARLLEVSLTPTPAYAGAQVSLVRSRTAEQGQGRERPEQPAWSPSAELIEWRQRLANLSRATGL